MASQLQALVDVHFPEATVIRVVLDNLNVHTPAVLYEAFAPTEARRIARKLDFHYTPKHGSWLNMDELDLAALSRQCLAQRVPTRERVAGALLGGKPRATRQSRSRGASPLPWPAPGSPGSTQH